MIHVTIYEPNRGFTVEGHARFAESGQDIVCSAVSAVTQTALAGLYEFCNTTFSIHDGRLVVTVLFPNQTSEIIIQTMRLGLEDIASQYNDYVKVESFDE